MDSKTNTKLKNYNERKKRLTTTDTLLSRTNKSTYYSTSRSGTKIVTKSETIKDVAVQKEPKRLNLILMAVINDYINENNYFLLNNKKNIDYFNRDNYTTFDDIKRLFCLKQFSKLRKELIYVLKKMNYAMSMLAKPNKSKNNDGIKMIGSLKKILEYRIPFTKS